MTEHLILVWEHKYAVDLTDSVHQDKCVSSLQQDDIKESFINFLTSHRENPRTQASYPLPLAKLEPNEIEELKKHLILSKDKVINPQQGNPTYIYQAQLPDKQKILNSTIKIIFSQHNLFFRGPSSIAIRKNTASKRSLFTCCKCAKRNEEKTPLIWPPSFPQEGLPDSYYQRIGQNSQQTYPAVYSRMPR
jgi:hypothetical protein